MSIAFWAMEFYKNSFFEISWPLKFGYSEKATKFEKILHLKFDVTELCQILIGRFFHIFWPPQNIWIGIWIWIAVKEFLQKCQGGQTKQNTCQLSLWTTPYYTSAKYSMWNLWKGFLWIGFYSWYKKFSHILLWLFSFSNQKNKAPMLNGHLDFRRL